MNGFGLTSEKSFANRKKKKLDELREYAEFEELRGKINITKILDCEKLVYVKKNSKNYRIIKEEFDNTWDKSNLDTCANVAKKIKAKRQDLTLKLSSTENYTRLVRTELYGKPFGEKGILGKCESIWCKKYEDHYEYLTEEEEKLRKDILNKWYDPNKSVEQQMYVHEMVDKGIIKAEVAWDLLKEISNMDNSFRGYLSEIQEKLGCQIVRGTVIFRDGTEYIEFKN